MKKPKSERDLTIFTDDHITLMGVFSGSAEHHNEQSIKISSYTYLQQRNNSEWDFVRCAESDGHLKVYIKPKENEQQKPQIIEQEKPKGLDLVRNGESWQVLNPITTKEQAIQLVNYINSDENTKGLRLNVSKITNKEIAQELINSHKTLSIELSQNKEADINTDMLQILSNYQHPLYLYGFSTTKWTKEQIQNLQNYKGEDLLIGGTIEDQDLHLLSGIKTKLQLPLLDYHKINFEHFVDFQCKELILDNIHHLTKNDTQYLKQYIDQGGTLTFGVNHQSQYAREGGYDGIMNCFEGYNIRTNNDNIFYQITINKKDK